MQNKCQLPKEENVKKLNNKGFSLMEVLIAVIILSIVSIPIIRSFATVAKTNANSKILLRATNAAENMMENIEYQTLDELVARYDISDQNTVTIEADGKYKFTIDDVADIPVKLPDGYRMTILADPTLYPNSNALNIADVRSMSITDTAVYEMSSLFDSGVYEKFDQWNRESHEDSTLMYQRTNKEYFKKNLSRTLEVVIDKVGTDVNDETGEPVDLVTVNLKVRYYFRLKAQYQNYLPNSLKEYQDSMLH